MNLPSDVTLPELKLHLEFNNPNEPLENSVKTSKYFSNISNYNRIDNNFLKYIECKDSTLIVHCPEDKEWIYLLACKNFDLSEPFYVEYYLQVEDGEDKNICVPTFYFMIYFTDNLLPNPPGYTYGNYFGDFYFQNQFWVNSCYLNLMPWSYGNSISDYGPTFESINDTNENLYFDVNSKYINTWDTINHNESAIPIRFGKNSVETSDYKTFKKLKDYLNIKDNEYIKYGFLANIDSNNFIHNRYYINDILVSHLKSKQTHSPSNIVINNFIMESRFNENSNFQNSSTTTILKDFKIYCKINNDKITKTDIKDGIAGTNWFNGKINVVEKKYIQDGSIGTNWFNCDIKVIEDPSLKSKEAVEDEINKQLALNPYINLNELQIFARINDNNLYPVQFAIQDGKVHIKYTDFIAKKQLYIGSKRQFIHHQYIL